VGVEFENGAQQDLFFYNRQHHFQAKTENKFPMSRNRFKPSFSSPVRSDPKLNRKIVNKVMTLM